MCDEGLWSILQCQLFGSHIHKHHKMVSPILHEILILLKYSEQLDSTSCNDGAAAKPKAKKSHQLVPSCLLLLYCHFPVEGSTQNVHSANLFKDE